MKCRVPSHVKKSLIGAGSYGKVYLLHDTTNDSKTVLKFSSDALQERMKHFEIFSLVDKRCQKYFPKPMLIPTYCKEPNVHALEYLNGVSLDVIAKQLLRSRSIDGLHILMYNVQSAIMCLWKSGFVHMDLHTHNIIVEPDLNIKIIDFGLSQRASPLSTSPKSLSDISKWFTSQYNKGLYKLSIPEANPNLYIYGIKTRTMYHRKSQNLMNNIYKVLKTTRPSSIKTT